MDTSVLANKRIDVDTHFAPRIDRRELRELLPARSVQAALDMLGREADRVAAPKAIRREMLGEPAPEEMLGQDPWSDPEARLEVMKPFGFDMQVLIPDGPFFNLYGAGPYTIGAPLEVRLAMCRLFNTKSAEAQAKFPDSFIGTTIVPFDDVALSCQEIRRAVYELGLKVLVIPFNWMGKNFDELELYPFWEAVNELGVTVFMHGITQGCSGNIGDHQPRYPAAFAERMRRLHLGTYMGFGMEYTMACGSLTLGGIFDEFPDLRICFFEAGASWLAAAMYSCDRSFLIEPQCSRSATLPSELIARHCLTAIEPMENIEQIVKMTGNDLYFFGTDFPHPEFQTFHGANRSVATYEPGAAAIEQRSELSDEDKAKILGGNIARVLSR